MVTVRFRSMVWFATGVVLATALTLMFVNAWRVDAAPGDSDATLVSITPCRLIDTRPAPLRVGTNGIFRANDTRTIAATGTNGNCTIPADAVGVSLNVTAVDASAPTFLTLWPEGDRPLASSLNPAPGQPPTPNAVTTPLSGTGSFELFNRAGSVDVIIDVNGYYTKSSLQELAADVASLQAQLDDLATTGLADDSVTSSKILDGAVAESDLADDSVTSPKILDGAVAESDLADDSVTSSKILDESVLGIDLAAGTVTGTELAANSVGSTHVIDDSLTTSDLGTASVGASEIATAAVGASEIASNAVGASEIASNAVGSSEIASNAVGASEVAASAVGSSEIAANAVGASEVTDRSLRMADLSITNHQDASVNLFGTINNGSCSSTLDQAASGAVANNLTVVYSVRGSGSDGWTIEGEINPASNEGRFRICNNTGSNADPPNLTFSFLTIGV